MGAMIELFLFIGICGAVGWFAGRFALRLYLGSDAHLHRIQEANRRMIERRAASGHRCEEHGRTFAAEELVRFGSSVMCPECYREHILESGDARPLTDLGKMDMPRLEGRKDGKTTA